MEMTRRTAGVIAVVALVAATVAVCVTVLVVVLHTFGAAGLRKSAPVI